MLANLGLVLIIIGWLIQFSKIQKKKKEIDIIFVLLYALGVLFLIIDGFQNNLTTLALLNLASLFSVILVILRLSNKSK